MVQISSPKKEKNMDAWHDSSEKNTCINITKNWRTISIHLYFCKHFFHVLYYLIPMLQWRLNLTLTKKQGFCWLLTVDVGRFSAGFSPVKLEITPPDTNGLATFLVFRVFRCIFFYFFSLPSPNGLHNVYFNELLWMNEINNFTASSTHGLNDLVRTLWRFDISNCQIRAANGKRCEHTLNVAEASIFE